MLTFAGEKDGKEPSCNPRLHRICCVSMLILFTRLSRFSARDGSPLASTNPSHTSLRCFTSSRERCVTLPRKRQTTFFFPFSHSEGLSREEHPTFNGRLALFYYIVLHGLRHSFLPTVHPFSPCPCDDTRLNRRDLPYNVQLLYTQFSSSKGLPVADPRRDGP